MKMSFQQAKGVSQAFLIPSNESQEQEETNETCDLESMERYGSRYGDQTTILFLGRTGAGKTTCFKCVTNADVEQRAPNSETRSPVVDRQILNDANGNHHLSVAIDTIGNVGDYTQDYARLTELLNSLAENHARCSMIYIVFNGNRFTGVDQAIVDMIRDNFSEEALRTVRFIVTHCSVHDQSRIENEYCDKLRFVGHDIANRIHCVDFIDLRQIESPSEKITVYRRRQSFRNTIRKESHEATDSVPLARILKPWNHKGIYRKWPLAIGTIATGVPLILGVTAFIVSKNPELLNFCTAFGAEAAAPETAHGIFSWLTWLG